MSNVQCTSAPMSTVRNALLGLSLCLTLTACTTLQPAATSGRTPPANVQNLEGRARTEAANGNRIGAADLYTQLAATVAGALRSGYLIEAARLLLDGGDVATARRRVAEVRAEGNDQQQAVVVLLARLDLEEGRPEAALDRLATLAQPVSEPAQSDAAAVRGMALFGLGQHAEAVRVLVEREIWLDDSAQVLANQRMIWDGLREPSMGTALTPTGDRVIDGWLALAPLARSANGAPDLRRELLAWRETYTDHPAAGRLLAELLSVGRSAGYPAQIALLLPMTSPQRLAALAIRDGFFAAHLRGTHGNDTLIRVYDTAALGAQDAYLRAQLEGADFIVGPLLQPEVEQVIAQAGFVPTLALNFAQNETPTLTSFYQFALAPEDEVRAIAQRAVASGATTAVALVPNSNRGRRLLNAFRAEFESLGGELLDFSDYDTAAQDFAVPITALLNITLSNQRYRRLAANLGTSIQFEPRRRQDVDLIFLAADSSAARMLAPQLRFNSAGDIPTYATSDVFEPRENARDNDLNGVVFADTPSLLSPDETATGVRSELQLYWPQRSSQFRFYGMGFDAYQLVAPLYEGSVTSWPLPGMSGNLTLERDGKIHRSLPVAQFQNGRPLTLPDIVSLPPAQGSFGLR